MATLRSILTTGKRRTRLLCVLFGGLIFVVTALQIWNTFHLNNTQGIITDDCSITRDSLVCKFGKAWDTSGKHTDSAKEVKHIAFLKAHKVAGSTVMNLFMRFGYSRNLTFVLPKNSKNVISQHGYLNDRDIHPQIDQGRFDMLCHHVVYNQSAWQRYLHKDAFYVSIIRDPFDQFLSSFHYFRKVWGVPYLHNITGEFPMTELLRHPERHEPKLPAYSFTNNRMALDFGFPPSLFDNPLPEQITKYISYLDSSFHFVMIKEHFDESVVLLKHFLSWTMKDILYVRQNTISFYRLHHDIQPGDRELHRQRAPLDYALYEYFLLRFWKQIRQQDAEFHREVLYFKHLRGSVETFCRHVFMKDIGVFETNHNQWHMPFKVTKEDCYLIMMNENDFSVLLKRKQYPYLQPTSESRYGPKRSRKRTPRRLLPPHRPNIFKEPL
ncbi:galactose-3-O-sulfotransferase 2-like [Mizuhopecten yessoensis]|uniref:Galactosylceramide sulfotransferase n=1 Tax=Mizuhopecten yessoensis TaxID=6573 RepID=A0A210PIS3_MIZYE|nr:galactose-3-O-sulfotransferase 2-like [Mizuhopecten yessoensis]OWF36401.1 Galactosylceramide sulfotransferase [Mizuhopecten yessoensis]